MVIVVIDMPSNNIACPFKISALTFVILFCGWAQSRDCELSTKPGHEVTRFSLILREQFCGLEIATTSKEKALGKECFDANYSKGKSLNVPKPTKFWSSKLTEGSPDFKRNSCMPAVAIFVEGSNRFGESRSEGLVCFFGGSDYYLAAKGDWTTLMGCNSANGGVAP